MRRDPAYITPHPERGDSPSRVYEHPPCSGLTTVDGREFLVLSDPFTFVTYTNCRHCGDFVNLDDVHWVGDDETIAETRSRIWRRLPFWKKIWGRVVGPLAGGVVGCLGGLVWPPHRMSEILTGFLGGAIVGWLTLQVPARHFVGMDFRQRR